MLKGFASFLAHLGKTHNLAYPIWGKNRFSDPARTFVFWCVFRPRSMRLQIQGNSVSLAAEKAGCGIAPRVLRRFF